jgi:hypothetical protein
VWLHTPVIPALERLRQKDPKFESSQGYISRPYLRKERYQISRLTLWILGTRKRRAVNFLGAWTNLYLFILIFCMVYI